MPKLSAFSNKACLVKVNIKHLEHVISLHCNEQKAMTTRCKMSDFREQELNCIKPLKVLYHNVSLSIE